MLLLFILPIALRLALLPRSPVPEPSGSDDFGYLLLADTLLQGRLANPPHPLSRFFETIFVLQQPTYSSMFSLGQGFLLAFGALVFRTPWAGVLVSIGALCSLCYWMLRAWISPGWALLGGLLAVITFGPLSYWTNCYWGGAIAACAGCLIFGALPRLHKQPSLRNGALLGIGFGAHLLTRPFESILLLIAVALYFALVWRSGWGRCLAPLAAASVFVSAALLLIGFQNKQVTGLWTTTPYMLYRYQYGVPATFTFQSNAAPHHPLTSDQELDYRAETAIHGEGPETASKYFRRLLFRLRFLRFFLLAPLYAAALMFLLTVKDRRSIWVIAAIAVFALGSNFFPYFYPHYAAAVTCLLLFIAVSGLARLSAFKLVGRQPGPALVYVMVLLCASHFLFWYGLHASAAPSTRARLSVYDGWDFINYGDPEHRIAIARQLAQMPGPQLVIVHYGPRHGFHQWIHNAAEIDSAHVVWARDLGAAENQALLDYYPKRTVWLLNPDAWTPRLVPYAPATKNFESVP